jgi:asparagine synthase (glutamine-hydrolysing)
MSALAALWYFDGQPNAHVACNDMLTAQKQYGLDATDSWSGGSVSLGRRLMHLLPEDRFDRQPLLGSGDSTILVADLRLDNRDELARELSIPETAARLYSDADLLLAALEKWDKSCLDHLVGDYAFIRWDSARQEMLLVRDPFGQRPLYFYRGNRFFAAASMPKGLHALSDVPYAPDQERISKWLALDTDVGSKSFFLDVERVEPGHMVCVTFNGARARRFWMPRRNTISLRSPQEYAEAMRHHLDQAVRCRLRGALDVATHLSSGFDSSAVSATAARLLAPSGGKVVAYTAVPREGYDGPSPYNRIIDESPLAAATAILYKNMEHVLIRSRGKSPLDDLDRCFPLFDQPMLTLCNLVWLNSINDAARKRNLRVLLTGEMGNITLSYDGLFLLPELFRQGRWFHWLRESRAIVARRGFRWRGIAARTFGPWVPDSIRIWLERVINGQYQQVPECSLIHPERLADIRGAGRKAVSAAEKDGFLRRLEILCSDDYGNWNKGILAGWQIDRRDPTVDLRLVEFCLAVPTEHYLRDGVPRALARNALSDRLPKVVLEESRRGVQSADWHERLTAIRDQVALEIDQIAACPAAARMLDLEKLRSLVENWPAEGWERDDISSIYRGSLLRAISIGHFMRSVAGKAKVH